MANEDFTSLRPDPRDRDSAKGYALSGKIMLSAIIILFAVVVIMVFLHIYARWYLLRARRRQYRRGRRRTHLVFYVEPNNPASIIASYPPRGLDKNVLKSLPTFTFSTKTHGGGEDGEEVLECAVCLSEFEENEKCRLLPKCNHSFHVDCIDMWFHSHTSCPLCRSAVDGEFSNTVKGGDDSMRASAEEESVVTDVVVDIEELNRRVEDGNSEFNFRPNNECEHQSGAAVSSRLSPSMGVGSSSSFAGRRKGADFVGVEIEVPRRCTSFSNGNWDECLPAGSSGQTMKSPTSRLLTLKKMLSRERKSPFSSPSSGVGTSFLGGGTTGGGNGCGGEADVELSSSSGIESQPPSQAHTPR